MTNTVMENDGKYSPNSLEHQAEVAWIIKNSGKTPALLGLDFMHGTGKNSKQEWYTGYTNATLALAEDVYNKGGIPAYCWHWKDPTEEIEAFYSPSSGNSQSTSFNLFRAFSDSSTCTQFNTGSVEYQGIVRDLDKIAGHLKTLADKSIPVLWRPMHEASGKWFWWGYKGPKACVALYRFMFDRFVNHHGLKNLVWVWTTDEAGDASEWYPGDAYVDIVGRDYYYYPREANHGSLVASFEKIKEIYGARKLIALTENGSIPHPDSLLSDGSGWSYFMPWYGDYTMDGWAHDNTAADWNFIMNHPYVLTLDKMPGWSKYIPTRIAPEKVTVQHELTMRISNGFIEVRSPAARMNMLTLYTLQGKQLARVLALAGSDGTSRFHLSEISRGIYVAKVQSGISVLQRKVTIYSK